MSAWADVIECKRGVVERLRAAAARLELPGACLDDIDRSMAELAAAKLSLAACRQHASRIAAAEKARTDVQWIKSGEGVPNDGA